MKTINNSIKNSTFGSMTRSYRYGILFLLSGIMATAISFFIFILGNMYDLGYYFNF